MEVKIENKCIIFGVCYRPPGQSALEATVFFGKIGVFAGVNDK